MSAESAPADKLLGRVLASRYEILQRLGEGAMGAVYKARHVKVGRVFAVKVLHARLLSDPKTAQRFAREAELAGRLRHANVVGVVDVGEVDGMHYMVMDFAEGPDLAQLLSEAPMPPARIIGLVRQMLEGLYHAHEQGLIHRDFKPENVIVERDSHGVEMPRIVDFGIALLREGGDSVDGQGRLTTNGLVLGTPHYMAPEQAVADPIDHRIDLFALGIVIYEMLSGRLPFDGSGAEVARANLLLDPPPISQRVPFLEVDPLLEAFARQLMAKKRTARPANADAARQLLDLIERDRRAAGVALGVPWELSVRAPAITESVTRVATAAMSADRTLAMRPTPQPGPPPGHDGVPKPSPALASEPVFSDVAPRHDASHTGPARGGADALSGPSSWRSPPSSGPNAAYTLPGPPIVFGAPPQRPGASHNATDRGPAHHDTARKTPLGWPPSRREQRRAALILGSLAVGAAGVVAIWLLAQDTPRRDRRDEPHIALSSLPPAEPAAIAPSVDPAPPSVDPAPPSVDPAPPSLGLTPPTGQAGDAAPRDGEPSAPTRKPIAPAVKPPAARPGRTAPSELARPRLQRELPPAGAAVTRPGEAPPSASADPRPAAPAMGKPASPPPTAAAITPAPAPVAVKPAKPACDLAAPDVSGITPTAVSNLWYRVPAELNKFSVRPQDLWERFTRYNVQELMRAPQATRDRAAVELWRILKEAGCRRAS